MACIGNCLTQFVDISMYPVSRAASLRNEAVDEKSWSKGILSRVFFIAQVVTSIVALPFSLLTVIFLSPLTLCSKDLRKELIELPKGHVYLIIACFLSTFAPHSAKVTWPFTR